MKNLRGLGEPAPGTLRGPGHHAIGHEFHRIPRRDREQSGPEFLGDRDHPGNIVRLHPAPCRVVNRQQLELFGQSGQSRRHRILALGAARHRGRKPGIRRKIQFGVAIKVFSGDHRLEPIKAIEGHEIVQRAFEDRPVSDFHEGLGGLPPESFTPPRSQYDYRRPHARDNRSTLSVLPARSPQR